MISNLSESAVMTTLRSFLLSILPTGVEVVRGQVNRVPSPASPDYVVLTPLLKERLATNVDEYQDDAIASVRHTTQSLMLTVQADVHGDNSADNADVISTLFRDDAAVSFFGAQGTDVSPLYTSEPRQIPFINGEQQVETRWVIDLAIECDPTIDLAQDFLDQPPDITSNPI